MQAFAGLRDPVADHDRARQCLGIPAGRRRRGDRGLGVARTALAPPPSKPSEEKPYTTHLEPVKQGGGTYARCTGCSREIIPVGRFDKLSHAADCPVGEEGE